MRLQAVADIVIKIIFFFLLSMNMFLFSTSRRVGTLSLVKWVCLFDVLVLVIITVKEFTDRFGVL